MRHPFLIAAGLAWCLQAPATQAFDFGSLGKGLGGLLGGDNAATEAVTDAEIGGGLKEALAQGVETAVNALGQTDGFLGNELVKIAVPEKVQSIAKLARKFGAGGYVDNFETSMNRAAEKAVPEAASIFGDTIRDMSMEDVRGILAGGDTAASDYLRKTAGERLVQSFRPIVEQTTGQAGVTSAYKNMVSRAGPLAAMAGGDATDLDGYVTNKTVDGLFTMIAAEEKRIRENPLARGSDLLKKVFGSI